PLRRGILWQQQPGSQLLAVIGSASALCGGSPQGQGQSRGWEGRKCAARGDAGDLVGGAPRRARRVKGAPPGRRAQRAEGAVAGDFCHVTAFHIDTEDWRLALLIGCEVDGPAVGRPGRRYGPEIETAREVTSLPTVKRHQPERVVRCQVRSTAPPPYGDDPA